MASEEEKVIKAENSTEILTAFNRIPYALISAEMGGATKDTLDELTQICGFYKVYKKGASFAVEGSNGDYVPATLKHKMAASLINKEARFLFAEPPDIKVEANGDVGKSTESAKDCFIGKRVAILVNFNEEDGVTITFLPSTQFIYETKIGSADKVQQILWRN